MKNEFVGWSTSDYAAWWGAVIATFALAWNIIREFRSGPRIRVSVSPNMEMFPRLPGIQKKYITVTAVNLGNSATTVTHLGGFHSSHLWYWRKKKRTNFLVGPGILGDSVPYVLRPGEEWKGLIDESVTPMREYLLSGYLYVGVWHNQSKHLACAQVRGNVQQGSKAGEH